MQNITLLGVFHKMDTRHIIGRQLLGKDSEKKFRECVLSRIDDATILFLEGAYEKELVTPGHRKYERFLDEIPVVRECGKRPAICRMDIRATLDPEAGRRYVQGIAELFRFCTHHAALQTVPTSIEDIPRMMREKDTGHAMRLTPPRKLRESVKQLLSINARWNTETITRMEHFANENRQCFLVAGTAHAVGVHCATGWPIELLLEAATPQELRHIWRGCLNMNVFAHTIRGY